MLGRSSRATSSSSSCSTSSPAHLATTAQLLDELFADPQRTSTSTSSDQGRRAQGRPAHARRSTSGSTRASSRRSIARTSTCSRRGSTTSSICSTARRGASRCCTSPKCVSRRKQLAARLLPRGERDPSRREGDQEADCRRTSTWRDQAARGGGRRDLSRRGRRAVRRQRPIRSR